MTGAHFRMYAHEEITLNVLSFDLFLRCHPTFNTAFEEIGKDKKMSALHFSTNNWFQMFL